MRVPIALSAVLLVAAVSGAACAQNRQAPDAAPRMDAALRRLAATDSDTIVGVFIRTARPPTARERRRLERAGARIGTVTGNLLTARIAARRLRDVAALPFVTYMEVARPLRPLGAARPPASSPHVSDGIA